MISLATGLDISTERLFEYAEKIVNLGRVFNVMNGIRREDDTIPEKFFKDTIPDSKYKGEVVKRDKFNKMLDDFYTLRGWNIKTGIPTQKKLRTGIR